MAETKADKTTKIPVAAAEKKPAKKAASKTAKPTAPSKASVAKKPTGHTRTPDERLHGKKYNQARAKLEADKHYPVDEAADLVIQTSTVNFDATVEVHMKLGVDPAKAEENIRGTVKLPAGTGKTLKVMAFVPAAKQAAAKKAGADFVSDEATLKKLQGGWTGFDVAVATPDQMPEVAKLGKVLGPKGLMPNPKAGTVAEDPSSAIEEVKKGTIEFRVAKDATLHAGIGKVSFKPTDLAGNLTAYYRAINGSRPNDFKGTFIRSVTLASTMGPGIRVDIDSLQQAAKGVPA